MRACLTLPSGVEASSVQRSLWERGGGGGSKRPAGRGPLRTESGRWEGGSLAAPQPPCLLLTIPRTFHRARCKPLARSRDPPRHPRLARSTRARLYRQRRRVRITTRAARSRAEARATEATGIAHSRVRAHALAQTSASPSPGQTHARHALTQAGRQPSGPPSPRPPPRPSLPPPPPPSCPLIRLSLPVYIRHVCPSASQ